MILVFAFAEAGEAGRFEYLYGKHTHLVCRKAWEVLRDSMPPTDAVRTEELIDWFGYDEPLEFSGDSPFGFYTKIGPSSFDDERRMALIRVGTRGVGRGGLQAV